MPVLEILDKQGSLVRGHNHAGLRVQATMHFPQDSKKRKAQFDTGIQDALLKAQQPVDPEIATLPFELGGRDGAIRRVEKSAREGWIAGEILIYVVTLAKHAPDHASIRKAQHLVACHTTAINRFQHRSFPQSYTAIENAWSRFKTVSHLWAALIFHSNESNGSNLLFDDPNLPSLLADAKWFETQGCRHHPPHMGNKSVPVLDYNEIWRIPKCPDIPSAHLELAPLLDDERRWLAEYRRR